MPRARPSIPEDALYLSDKLRKVDVMECACVMQATPLLALTAGYLHSDDPLTIVAGDGEVIGMFGVVPAQHRDGVVWMLVSDRISEPEIARQFVRQMRDQTVLLCDAYETVYNYVAEFNTQARKWLKLCGFREAGRITLRGIPHIYIKRTSQCALP